MELLSYVAMVLGILGALLVALRKPLAGHLVWCVGNPLWIVWGVSTQSWGVAIQFGVFWVIAAVGSYNWWKGAHSG